MPQRFLRPGITTSDRWNSVSWEAQSFYIRILTLVDDFGRFDGRIPILHGQCFALRDDIKPHKTAALRCELQKAGLLDVYAVTGKEFIQVTQWQERARTEKSKYPDPPQQPETTIETSKAQDSAANGSGPQDSASSLAIATTSSPSAIANNHLAPPSPGNTAQQAALKHEEVKTRLAAIFHRKPTTAWSKAELRALKALEFNPEELDTVERYYAESKNPYLRQKLLTLLNNYSGEVDSALAWIAAGAKPYASGTKHRTTADREHAATGIKPNFETKFL